MSLRVIRNRERQRGSNSVGGSVGGNNKYANVNNTNAIASAVEITTKTKSRRATTVIGDPKRRCLSCPELRALSQATHGIDQPHQLHQHPQQQQQQQRLVKSEMDLLAAITNAETTNACSNGSNFVNAKSEVCLKTISVHSTPAAMNNHHPLFRGMAQEPHQQQHQSPERQPVSPTLTSDTLPQRSKQYRKQSTSSSSVRNSPALMTRSCPSAVSTQISNAAYSNAIRIPIIGYEVMEERARFTVFKLRVENPFTNDCWLVLRRYTDFMRLHAKLKAMFPSLNVTLPKKKLFGDNFNNAFLDNRVQGLQQFVNTVMAEARMRDCQMVREFFCLDEPPTYSESMEECRAIFEAQEETIAHLKQQLRTKEAMLMAMEQKLKSSIESFKDHLAGCSIKSSTPTSPLFNAADVQNNNNIQ